LSGGDDSVPEGNLLEEDPKTEASNSPDVTGGSVTIDRNETTLAVQRTVRVVKRVRTNQ